MENHIENNTVLYVNSDKISFNVFCFESVDDMGFEGFWGPINMQLNFMNLEIRRIRYPYDRVKYMGIVNKVRFENIERQCISR